MADLPEPFTSRPYRAGDAAAVTALYNAVEVHAGGHPGYVEDETEAVIAATVADVETDSRLVFSSDGELVAAGVVAAPPSGGYRIDAYGGVAPRWRGRGVGRAVFDWQFGRAREIYQAAGSPADWVFEAGTIVGDDSAIRLYERFGGAPSRYFFEMVAPAKDNARPAPDGLRVQPYEPAFERTLYDAHMEAFSDHWGFQKREFDKWVGFTVRSDVFRSDLSRLAFDGDELVAYVLTYDDADPERVYVGQVGTRRPWRRRGLAGSLLADVLSGAAASGKGFVYLSVDADSPTGAVGLYEGAGFTTETTSVDYRFAL
jgi:ribosomal protein S18 acetylase RimI-like enzyme